MSRNPPLKVTETQKMSRMTKKVKSCGKTSLNPKTKVRKLQNIGKVFHSNFENGFRFRQTFQKLPNIKQENDPF